MSRTNRNVQYANYSARAIRHANYRRNELAALQEIIEELGNNYASNRLRSALNRIPTNYDDLRVSGLDEVSNI